MEDIEDPNVIRNSVKDNAINSQGTHNNKRNCVLEKKLNNFGHIILRYLGEIHGVQKASRNITLEGKSEIKTRDINLESPAYRQQRKLWE